MFKIVAVSTVFPKKKKFNLACAPEQQCVKGRNKHNERTIQNLN